MQSLRNFIYGAPKKDLDMDRRKRFLVVEDDPTYEPIWSHIFHQIDNEASYDWVQTVVDAEKKLAQAFEKGFRYDLVVCDVFLSDSQTGMDLWRKKFDVLGESFVMVSGIDQDKVEKLLGRGWFTPYFLKKPFNSMECVETFRSILNQQGRNESA